MITLLLSLLQHQDWLQNKTTFQQAWCQQQQLTAKSRNIVDLQIHWVPGHLDFSLNDRADELTKDAATGNLSPPRNLPTFLRKPLPTSVSTLQQELKSKIQWCWAHHWKTSPHCCHMGGIDKSVSLKKWMMLVKPLSQHQASLIMQLCTGQIVLNKHLHWIHCSETLSKLQWKCHRIHTPFPIWLCLLPPWMIHTPSKTPMTFAQHVIPSITPCSNSSSAQIHSFDWQTETDIWGTVQKTSSQQTQSSTSLAWKDQLNTTVVSPWKLSYLLAICTTHIFIKTFFYLARSTQVPTCFLTIHGRSLSHNNKLITNTVT